MAGAEEPEKTEAGVMDVEADFDHGALKAPGALAGQSHVDGAQSSDAVTEIVLDDGAIEVADEEIEVADVLPARPTQPSPSSSGVLRSRPPTRPSGRPRPPSGSSALPPPRARSGSEAGSGWPASNRPQGVDPWLLANKTLELSRAHARIAELDEQVAFRDARIVTLEQKLEKALHRLEELEQKPRAGRGSSTSAAQSPVAGVPPSAAAPVAAAPAFSGAAAPARAGKEAEDQEDEGIQDSEPAEADFVDSADATVAGDLRKISGIGPRFEAALRKQGITQLSQVAAWSEADVRQVAKALKIPKSRIVKGRWVEAAREAMSSGVASE